MKNITPKEFLLVFFLAVFTRYMFSIFSGVDNFAGPDNWRYLQQSVRILQGNFNLEEKLFITAPLFPYILALFKWLFASKYVLALEAFQIILSGVSVIFLMLSSKLIFRNYYITLLTGLVYSVYPVTLYYAHQFSQESIFQSLFIISIYYFLLYMDKGRLNSLIKFSLIFSLALLTKSIILLIFPFLMLSVLIKFSLTKKTVGHVFSCAAILLLMTFPYGAYNKLVNGSYVIASSGQGGHFLTGHNDDFYTYIANPPPRDSKEYRRLNIMEFKIFDELKPIIEGKNHKFQQDTYLKAGIKWSLDNPKKVFEMAWVNFRNFIMPGFNILHHPFNMWLLTFMISLPIFIFAYVEIIRNLFTNYKSHLTIVSIFSGMLSVAIIFYTYNRYRTVTIEPYYVMYACSFMVYFFQEKFKFFTATKTSTENLLQSQQ